MDSHVMIKLKLVVRRNFILSLFHLFSAFNAELVMMRPKYCNLLEENMIFFSQKVQSITHSLTILQLLFLTIFTLVQILEEISMVSGLFD